MVSYFDINILSSYMFQFFIVLAIGFLGALLSDIWYYFKHQQRMDLKEDIIVGIVDAGITNFIVGLFEYNGWKVNIRLLIAASFLGGIWGIDLLTIIMHPAQVFTIFKSVLKSSSHTIMHDIGTGLDTGMKEAKDIQHRRDRKLKEEQIKQKEQNSTNKATNKNEPKVHNNELVNEKSNTIDDLEDDFDNGTYD